MTDNPNELTIENSVLVLIDHQPAVALAVHSIDHGLLIDNVAGLARAAKDLGVPTVLTTVGAQGSVLVDPIFKEISEVFPDVTPIDRPSANAWSHPDVQAAVEATGREALQELRGFLGVLDPEDDGLAELAPQPGTADVESLLQRVTHAGLPVELQVRGERKVLPPGLDLAAYRVVQEGLTNALKYADRARTEVVLDYRSDGIEVEVLDEGPGRALGADGDSEEPAGRGLAGLRERVALYGGSVEAGRRPSGGFALRAWLPSTLPVP